MTKTASSGAESAATPVPAVGSRWRRMGFTYKVYGVVDGYVVYRQKGAGMCIQWWRDFVKNHVPVVLSAAGGKS